MILVNVRPYPGGQCANSPLEALSAAVDAMKSLASKSSISRDTQLCISLSARPGNFGTRFQNNLYAQLGLDFIYKSFSTTDLGAALGGVRALGIRGCAISMPFKEACIPMLDVLDPSAAAIGSVNTIVNEQGRLRGYNTDYLAIRQLIGNHRIGSDTPVILCGSGGMGKAVAAAFRDAGFRHATLVARNAATGRAVADDCGFRWVRDLSSIAPGSADGSLLVNATPIGMAGGAGAGAAAFPADMIVNAHTVFDVVAIPIDTPLIREARAAGRATIDGGEVLVLQGLEQFVLYTGTRPNAEQVATAAAVALA